MHFLVNLNLLDSIQTSTEHKLDAVERFIVSYIYSFKENGYYGTLDTLANVSGVSRSTIKSRLRVLKTHQILIKNKEYMQEKERYFLNPKFKEIFEKNKEKSEKNKEKFPKNKEKN